MPGIIYRLNPDGVITFINKAGLEFLGYAEEEVLGKPFFSFLPASVRAEVVRHYQTLIAGEISEEYYEFPFLLADGSITHFGQHVRLIYEHGAFSGAFAVAQCVTTRHEQAAQLQLAHQRLQRLVGNLDDAILVEDENSKIHLINRQFCELFNIPAEPASLKGADCSEAAEQSKHLFKDPEAFVSRINDLLEHKKKTTGELLEMADGRVLERSYIPVIIDDDYRGHLWKYTDISDRIILQRRLEEQEEKYRMILENMELGVMEVDNDDRITRVYDAMCRLTGYREEELIGRKAADVFLPSETNIDIVEFIADRKNKQSSVYTTQIKSKKGDLIHVLISGAPVTRKGEVIGSIGIHYDITELIETQEALEQQTHKAEAARKNEETLLRRVIHELQLPFDGLAGLIRQLSEKDRIDTSSEQFKLLCEGASLLGQTISETVEAVTNKSGRRTELKHSPTDISQLTASVIALHGALESSSDVEVDHLIDGEPSPPFSFPRAMLFQVLMQLVTIARHALWNGRVNLSYTIEPTERKEISYVDFCVYARGTFSPLAEAVSGTLNRAHLDGTDVNPDVAEDLIEELGGEFMIDRGLGDELMIRASFEMSAVPRPELPSDPQHDAHELIRTGCFLIAESSKLQREYLQNLFNKWHADEVAIVDNEEDALALRKKKAFDLILCDTKLAKGVIRRIRAFEREKNLPKTKAALFVLRKNADRELQEHVDGIIQRPFKPAQLRHDLTLLLRPEQAETAPDFTAFEQVFEEYYGNDSDQLLKIVRLFEEGFPELEDSLKRLDATSDLVQIRSLLHKNRPSFQMIGLVRSYEMASAIEEMMDLGKSEEAFRQYPLSVLLDCIRAERKDLERFLEASAGSGA